MKESGCKMSSTDGLIGYGIYDSNTKYEIYNAEHYYTTIQNLYRTKGSKLLDNGFPIIWDLNFLRYHNCVICSSVVLEKCILNTIQNMKCLVNGQEDYDCWLRALEHTNCIYVTDTCFYYDASHGAGRNY